jgi:ketosteroid isomerase-like protein
MLPETPWSQALTYEDQCSVLDRLFAAVSSGDVATVESIYAPDAGIWHNTDNATQAVVDNLRTIAWVGRTIRGMSYDEVRRAPIDRDRVLQQHVLRGTAPNGAALEIPACMVVAFNDAGRIARLEEYIDSGAFAALRS